ncbi:MAG: hypothetical protein AABX44_01950 [Nanoarchaeota archaeon]
MNKKEYLSSIFKENKQCNCDYLIRFFFLEKKFNELENLCNDLLDFLSKHKFGSNIKKIYGEKNYERICFYKELNLELNSLIKKGKLKLFYHNEKNNYEKQPISYEQRKKLEDKLITASCSKCNQQIKVLK